MITDLNDEKKDMIEVLNEHIERVDEGDNSQKTRQDVEGLDEYIGEIDKFLNEINGVSKRRYDLFTEWDREVPEFVGKERMFKR